MIYTLVIWSAIALIMTLLQLENSPDLAEYSRLITDSVDWVWVLSANV